MKTGSAITELAKVYQPDGKIVGIEPCEIVLDRFPVSNDWQVIVRIADRQFTPSEEFMRSLIGAWLEAEAINDLRVEERNK